MRREFFIHRVGRMYRLAVREAGRYHILADYATRAAAVAAVAECEARFPQK